ncbi:MAG: HlyD family secretion protein [Terriglobales bacterium]
MALEAESRWRSRKIWLTVGGVLLVTIALIAALTRKKATAYFEAPVTRGDITAIVQATGTVNAVTTVQVGSQVSGRIEKIYVDFNSQVHKGQLIAEIEKTVYQGQVLQAQADVANAQANVTALQANVGVAQQDVISNQANVERAQSALDQARLDRDRTLPLFSQGIVSAQQRDQVTTTYEGQLAALHVAQATEQQSVAKLKAAHAQLLQAEAQVQQKRAAQQVAQINLNHCEIYAPVDGVVINRAVDVGQTVAASFNTPTLFTIAQDLSKMQVYTKTDESDVGRLRVGDTATFTVDAFPNETFHGVVSQIRMNATTLQNVVEYDTIITFDNPGNRVFPGMTAYVNIPVDTAPDALQVPNAALRFKPDLTPDALRALLTRYGMAGKLAASGGAGGKTAGGGGPREGGTRSAAGSAAYESKPVTLHSTTALLWKLDPTTHGLVPVRVRTGITDFTHTAILAVLKGELQAGDKVVTGVVLARGGAGAVPAIGGGPRR